MYLIALAPLGALAFKMENAFEQSANFSLKEVIKRGVDLKGKNSKLMARPALQAFKMSESSKLRRSYNFKLAMLYDNPLGHTLDIFLNINTGVGSRAFQRLLLGGQLATEYVVNFMNFLEEKGAPEWITKSCKSILTRNRTDL